jgi:hypothetical protein
MVFDGLEVVEPTLNPRQVKEHHTTKRKKEPTRFE